jgi:tRNA pseudouridine55 synthase
LTETGRIPDRLELPSGEIEQRVPMTSAVKVEGERLYKRAHRGEEIETPRRTVTVHRAELVEGGTERATFEIECSSGTYVRTLIETLQDAYCESLRRLQIGPFEVVDGSEREIGVEELMAFLPERELDSAEAQAVGHGRPVEGSADGNVRLTHDDRLIAIARADGENLRPEVVLT